MRTSILLLLFGFLSYGAKAQEFAEIDAFAKSVKFNTDYIAAANTLAEPYDDEKSKARAIFTWLASNMTYDHKALKRAMKSNVKGGKRIKGQNQTEIQKNRQVQIEKFMTNALRKKKGICQDFSWIFQAMLVEVGIEAEFITGYSRTNPEQMNRVPKSTDHAWNAAKINGDWHLFDVTWSIEGEGAGHRGFFMMPPAQFIKSHLPEEDKWQLLDVPMDLKSWSKKMYWYKSYAQYRMGAVKAGIQEVDESIFPADSLLSIVMALPPSKTLYAIKDKGDKRIKFKRKGNIHVADFKLNRFRGLTHIVVSEGKKSQPLVSFRVK